MARASFCSRGCRWSSGVWKSRRLRELVLLLSLSIPDAASANVLIDADIWVSGRISGTLSGMSTLVTD
jgi:hypothetical protein